MRETLQYITAENVGFNLGQEARITAQSIYENPAVLEIAARNIRTYEAETLEDHVVSYFPYFRNVYSAENRLFRLNSNREEDLAVGLIDLQERGGAVVEGFSTLEEDIGKTDTGWFLWISPKGPAGSEGIYKNITYRYHQVYIGEITKDMVDAYALKSDIDESVLATWVNVISKGEKRPDPKNPESFISNPVVLSCVDGESALVKSLLTLRTLLSVTGKNQFYQTVTVDEIFMLMKTQRVKQEAEVRQLHSRLSYELSRPSMVTESYVAEVLGNQMIALFSRYQDERGNVPLRGCVGGSISINQLFGTSSALEGGIFSSAFRLGSVGTIESSGSCSVCGKSAIDNHYHCPKCNEKYADETNLSSSQRTKKCARDNCDFTFAC